MKFKSLLLTITLLIANISYAYPYDNIGPESNAVDSGDDRVTIAQNPDLTQNQNTGIIPPSSTVNIPISRDGETMDDEDY